MILDEITIHNFGVYNGRQTISLMPDSDKKPVILIGGMNGVGKTTLMDAFQLSLFGKLANCSNRGSLAYDKYLRKSIHKAVDPKDGAAINIKFRHSASGIEHSYQVNRYWRMNKKNLTETVEVLCDGEYDPVITDAWHEHAEQFMPLRISSLFFFDGEKIKDLANFGKSTELISTGINQLLGLDLIDQLITDLIVLEKRKKLKLTGHVKRKTIEQIESKIRDLTKQKENLAWQKRNSEKTLGLLEIQIKEVDEKFRLEGGEIYNNREKLELKRLETSKKFNEIQEKLVDFAASELPVVLLSDILTQILHQSEIEEKSTNNEKLYETLKERDSSIINDLKTKDISQKTLSEIETLLKKDLKERSSFKQVEKYQNIDSETRDMINAILLDSTQVMTMQARNLIKLKINIEDEIENLDRKLANVPDAEAIAELIRKKEKIKLTKHKADINHAVLMKEIQNIEKVLFNAEKELEKELEKVFDAEYKHDSSLRIIKHSAKSRKTLALFKENVLKHHLERIQNYVLEAFRHLLRKEKLISKVIFDPVSYEPKIIGADNKAIDVQRLSAGERQLLAVSLLWGLAQASGRPLPTIIDTPLGRLDTAHRTHLVKRYFPFASHQVLLLSTDEEINEKYYRMIKPWVSREYHLNFNESGQSTTIEKGYFW
ncbi:DNA sulfur modification protein DndD [Thermodesulfobacteriota bacterium]